MSGYDVPNWLSRSIRLTMVHSEYTVGSSGSETLVRGRSRYASEDSVEASFSWLGIGLFCPSSKTCNLPASWAAIFGKTVHPLLQPRRLFANGVLLSSWSLLRGRRLASTGYLDNFPKRLCSLVLANRSATEASLG